MNASTEINNEKNFEKSILKFANDLVIDLMPGSVEAFKKSFSKNGLSLYTASKCQVLMVVRDWACETSKGLMWVNAIRYIKDGDQAEMC